MRVRSFNLVLGALGATLVVGAAPAGAAIVEPVGGLASSTTGIVLGGDGNLWVAEANNDSIARISPEGQFLQRVPLGGSPTNVSTGPGGKVWVAVGGAKKLVAIEATAATPTVTSISTAGLSNCGPVGLTDGRDGRMYFSMPNGSFGCTDPSRISSVNASATEAPAAAVTGGGGTVFDLAVAGGKLFAPDFDGGVVRRLTLGTAPSVEATLAAPLDSAPDGITVDEAGTIWVTAFSTGQVLRFAPTASAATVVPGITVGKLVSPFGIFAAGDGRIYVAGADSQNLLRLNADGTGATFFPMPADSRPWQIAGGPGGDLFVTDQGTLPRVLRFVNTAPRDTTGAAVASGPASGSVSATIDPRGNETQVVFDYGTTTAYGQTTPPTNVPAGTASVPVSAALTGLAAGTTYYARVRATNGEGTTAGAGSTFTTPPAVIGMLPPAGTPRLSRIKATASFSSKAKTTTVISSLRLKGLTGGETATVLCSGSKRCPFTKKTYKGLKAGSKTLGESLWKGRALPKGTKITVRIELPGFLGTSTALTIRKNKKPTTVLSCLSPGTRTKTSCT